MLTSHSVRRIESYDTLYSVFHRIGQAEFANGGSILSLSKFSLLSPAAFKKWILLQSGQNSLKNNHLATLIQIRETHCITPCYFMSSSS